MCVCINDTKSILPTLSGPNVHFTDCRRLEIMRQEVSRKQICIRKKRIIMIVSSPLILLLRFQDRNVITTKDAERKCVSPTGLQDEIDGIVSKYNSGRSFVRPSGTEDIVRVYAEAGTKDEADKLAAEVAQKVHELAGGIGSPPEIPA